MFECCYQKLIILQSCLIFRRVYAIRAEESKKFSFPVTSFCSDHAFWQDKCFSKEIAQNYTLARNCNVTHNDSSIGKKVTEDSCLATKFPTSSVGIYDDSFYCNRSKTCIPKSFTCNGAVNCVHAEDEDFELCKHTFPEGATVYCQEANRTQYNISIYAVPCDGIIECKDGLDEISCSWVWQNSALVIIFAYVIVNVSWYFTYYHVYFKLKADIKQMIQGTTSCKFNQRSTSEPVTSEEKSVAKIIDVNVTSYKLYWREKFSEKFGTNNVSEIKGDSLAWLKVK